MVKILVADGLREGGAEHRDRRGEDHLRLVAAAHLADGLEQVARAVEVDAVALLEIGFRLARDDGGEMEDHVGLERHQLFGLAGHRKVADQRLDREGRMPAEAVPAPRPAG